MKLVISYFGRLSKKASLLFFLLSNGFFLEWKRMISVVIVYLNSCKVTIFNVSSFWLVLIGGNLSSLSPLHSSTTKFVRPSQSHFSQFRQKKVIEMTTKSHLNLHISLFLFCSLNRIKDANLQSISTISRCVFWRSDCLFLSF